MKKLADILDKNGTPTNKGDYVFFDDWVGEQRLCKMLGKIIRINGAYIYVQGSKDKKDVRELYATELTKASEEDATLWMLEN